MFRKPAQPSTSSATVIHVQPRPESRQSDFEVISMDEAEGKDKNVQFDDVVVYSNPERHASIELDSMTGESGPAGGEVGVAGRGVNKGQEREGGGAGAAEAIVINSNAGEIVSIESEDNISSTSSEEHLEATPHHRDDAMDELLRDVLETRPTLMVGRSMSLRYRGGRSKTIARSESAYNRRNVGSEENELRKRLTSAPGFANRGDFSKSHTLPAKYQREISPNSPQHAISEEERVRSATAEARGFVKQITREAVFENEDEVAKSKANLRRSTRHLKERIRMHRQAQPVVHVARESLWDNFKSVKWPKFKSRLKVILSWELWKGHMKEIEGHFGTSVVSYFIFLRFIFGMNAFVTTFWFSLVVIPGIIHVQINDPPKDPSQLSCVYKPSNTSDLLCAGDDLALLGTNETLMDNGDFVFQLAVPDQYSCSLPAMVNGEPLSAGTFVVRECSFGEPLMNESLQYMIADREGSTTINVSTEGLPMFCEFTGDTPVPLRQLRLCSSGIAPRIVWYQYIIDFFLGQGIFNETILFYGRYGNTTVVSDRYSLPLAYLLMTAVIYAFSVILLVYKLGSAYNESYTQFNAKGRTNFSNKVFTAWDYNITDPDTAKLKRISIKTNLEEELADYDRRNLERTRKEFAIMVIIRIFTNLFTVLVLAAGSTAIYYAAVYGLENQSSTLEGLVLPVVISALNLVLPFLFSFLARFEKFKTQSGEISMTLLRTVIVRLSSLIVLIITLFILISCTQGRVEDETNTCQFSTQGLANVFTDSNSSSTSTSECPVCWETFVGQEFYKLGLTNFFVSAASTIAAETARNMRNAWMMSNEALKFILTFLWTASIASQVKYLGIGEKIGKGNFNVPKSILDLIYTQSLLWLGFFFSPLLPIVIMVTSFMLFYVKKYSLIYNLTPDKRGAFRAARTNYLFILLMLIALFLILLPIGYIIANFNPSETCGPFRGQDFIFTIVTENIDSLSCAGQQVFDFFGSIGFIIPLVVLLLLVIFSQCVLLKSRQERFKLVKKQLQLEGANVTHIVNKLGGVLTQVAEEEEARKKRLQEHQQKHPHGKHKGLKQRILENRESLQTGSEAAAAVEEFQGERHRGSSVQEDAVQSVSSSSTAV